MDIEEGPIGEEKPLTGCQKFNAFVFFCFVIVSIILFVVFLIKISSLKNPDPTIDLASMEFTVLNITDTRLSAKWDLSIRIPATIPGSYICLQGDLQASLLYKNVTLATSSPQKYYDLKHDEPQVLRVSAVVTREDIDGLIGKDIMEDMKEKKEVQFGARFFLTDCSLDTTGTRSYVCDEVTLRFEPGSEMKAALFGKHPSCISF